MDRDARIKELAERLAALDATTPERVIERLLEREWAAREAASPPDAPGFAEETQTPLADAEAPAFPGQWIPTPKAGRQAYMGYWDKDFRVFQAIPLGMDPPDEETAARYAQYREEMAEIRARHGLPREVKGEPIPKSFYDEMWDD